MRVAGFGFRAGVSLAALRSALGQAGGSAGLVALATAADKADQPAITALARELGLPLHGVEINLLADQAARSSDHVPARYGARSVAEAAALAAAGPGARLVVGRVISDDRLATAAIAEGIDP